MRDRLSVRGRTLATAALAATVLAGVLAAAPGRAAPTATAALDGRYAGTADLGPVLLDGRYVLEIGDSTPGTLDVETLVAGVVAGQVRLAARTEDVSGRVRTTRKGIRLDLRATAERNRLVLAAGLRGGEFVGTVRLGKRSAPCRIAVGEVAPLRGVYDLTLASSARGKVTGTGTVSVGRESIAVKARGTLRKGRVTLVASGGTTALSFAGGELAEDGASVTATAWKAKGFGAQATKGRPLVLRKP